MHGITTVRGTVVTVAPTAPRAIKSLGGAVRLTATSGDADIQAWLTPNEARELAAALIRQADAAEREAATPIES